MALAVKFNAIGKQIKRAFLILRAVYQPVSIPGYIIGKAFGGAQ